MEVALNWVRRRPRRLPPKAARWTRRPQGWRPGAVGSLLLAGLLALLSACAPESRADRLESDALQPRPPAVGGPRYGGHLRVAHSLEPTSLDAILGRSGADAYFWRQLFDQLVDADPRLDPRPETSLAV